MDLVEAVSFFLSYKIKCVAVLIGDSELNTYFRSNYIQTGPSHDARQPPDRYQPRPGQITQRQLSPGRDWRLLADPLAHSEPR